MATKKKGHTGFRNGDLFCFHCGRSYKISYPQPISMATAMMTQFAKDHKDCAETWVEPVNDDPTGKSEAENANWWAINGTHGTSSKAMFNCLSRQLQIRAVPLAVYERTQHPCDPDDFSRCYRLLKSVPQWAAKEKMAELKTLSPVWEKLVDNWDKLTAMYEENIATDWKECKRIGMYEFMRSLDC